MSSISDHLLEIGIRLPDLVAGAAGGLIRHIMLRAKGAPCTAPELVNLAASVVSGALCAAYLGDPLARATTLAPMTAGFIAGLAGLVLCQLAVDQAVKRFGLGGDKPPG